MHEWLVVAPTRDLRVGAGGNMKPQTYSELCKIVDLLNLGVVESDNDGQLIIYTGMKMKQDGANLIPVGDQDES